MEKYSTVRCKRNNIFNNMVTKGSSIHWIKIQTKFRARTDGCLVLEQYFLSLHTPHVVKKLKIYNCLIKILQISTFLIEKSCCSRVSVGVVQLS